MYLDDKLSTLDLKGQKIDDTFRIITETYRMHLFIAGALSDARIFDLSISLYILQLKSAPRNKLLHNTGQLLSLNMLMKYANRDMMMSF
jgi:hypothetical protein